MQRALRGAEKRRRTALSDAALAAWIGAHADKDGLREFLDDIDSGPRPAIPPEAYGHALESMAQKMAVITLDDYRARVRGGA